VAAEPALVVDVVVGVADVVARQALSKYRGPES
jgi:hypothetical protein